MHSQNEMNDSVKLPQAAAKNTATTTAWMSLSNSWSRS